MLSGSWGGPPPQYSGLPRCPVRVRKFRFNDFTTKFNRQWTPSKTPAPRRKEALNGKGGRTGSQPHATEAPLRGCHPQAGGRLLSTVPHAHHCADNLVFTLTSGKLRWTPLGVPRALAGLAGGGSVAARGRGCTFIPQAWHSSAGVTPLSLAFGLKMETQTIPTSQATRTQWGSTKGL